MYLLTSDILANYPLVKPAMGPAETQLSSGTTTRPTSGCPGSSAGMPPGLIGKACPSDEKKTSKKCKKGVTKTCPAIPDLLCVCSIKGVRLEYVAKTGYIKLNSKSKLYEVVRTDPNRIHLFKPQVGAQLSKFLANMVRFGMPVQAILTMGTTYCRCKKNSASLSNHSFGDAIDIAGVRWARPGGPPSALRATIIHNYNRHDSRERVLIRRINACLRLSFATVLDYNYTPRPHKNHFHCDLNYRNGKFGGREIPTCSPTRKSASTWYFVQEALSLILSRPICRDGTLNFGTGQALLDFARVAGITSIGSAAIGPEIFRVRERLNVLVSQLFEFVAAGKWAVRR